MKDNTLFEKHTEAFGNDMGMYYCGKRTGTKNHVYGPEIRSHFLIVLVEKGSAVLYRENSQIKFGEHDMLVMFPKEKIFYKALTEWTIKWIGVSGKQIENIFKMIGVTREKPVFKPEKYDALLKIMAEMYDIKYDNSMFVKYKIQSFLYDFFALLLLNADKKNSSDPVSSALKIIKYNYNNELSVKKISDSLFLDSAYFSRLFKRKTGISPKKYIIQMRMNKAKELLKETDYSIKEISVTVGFGDPLYFSKLFLRIEQITPSEYRKMYNPRFN